MYSEFPNMHPNIETVESDQAILLNVIMITFYQFIKSRHLELDVI